MAFHDFSNTINDSQYEAYLEAEQSGALKDRTISYNRGNAPIFMTSPANIHNTNTYGIDPDVGDFWAQHSRSKDDYLELASHIPDVQRRLQNGESLADLYQDEEAGMCAKLYFEPNDMIEVAQYGDTFISTAEPHRHRLLAAQELGYNVPVKVTEQYTDENGIAPAAYGNPYYQDISDLYSQQSLQQNASPAASQTTQYNLPKEYLELYPDVVNGTAGPVVDDGIDYLETDGMEVNAPVTGAPNPVVTEEDDEEEGYRAARNNAVGIAPPDAAVNSEAKSEPELENDLSDDYYYGMGF